MGSSFARLWSKGFLGGFGTPHAHPELEKLMNWSREDVLEAVQRFCVQPSLAVTLSAFGEVLRMQTVEEERLAFNRLKSKNDRVDMLSVFAAMVATSNQRFISRMSCLFSLFDLDSSGTINRAEFFIGVRALFHGLSLFFESALVPSRREMEDLTGDVFDRIDADNSKFITIGELLNFAYRSGELKATLEPFPATDERIFEQLVVFSRSSDEFRSAASLHVSNILDKLHLSPSGSLIEGFCGTRHSKYGPHALRKDKKPQFAGRAGPSKPPREFSKAHCWFVYRFFVQLAGGGMQNTLPTQTLQSTLGDENAVDECISQVYLLAAEVIIPMDSKEEDHPGFNKRWSIKGDTQELGRLAAHLKRYFHDRNVVAKLDAFGEGSVTLRAFFCVIFHSLSEGDIETCLRWCQAFRAHDVLKEYMAIGNTSNLSVEDVRTIFQAIDTDCNGMITLAELIEGGELEEDQARALMQRLDEDSNGTISLDELQGILRSIDTSLRCEFQDAFHRHNSCTLPDFLETSQEPASWASFRPQIQQFKFESQA
jgi:Ca2+-binding EF-hand superfamily protein